MNKPKLYRIEDILYTSMNSLCFCSTVHVTGYIDSIFLSGLGKV